MERLEDTGEKNEHWKKAIMGSRKDCERKGEQWRQTVIEEGPVDGLEENNKIKKTLNK